MISQDRANLTFRGLNLVIQFPFHNKYKDPILTKNNNSVACFATTAMSHTLYVELTLTDITKTGVVYFHSTQQFSDLLWSLWIGYSFRKQRTWLADRCSWVISIGRCLFGRGDAVDRHVKVNTTRVCIWNQTAFSSFVKSSACIAVVIYICVISLEHIVFGGVLNIDTLFR